MGFSNCVLLSPTLHSHLISFFSFVYVSSLLPHHLNTSLCSSFFSFFLHAVSFPICITLNSSSFICTSSSLPGFLSHLPNFLFLPNLFAPLSFSAHPLLLSFASPVLYLSFLHCPPLFLPTILLQCASSAGACCLPICPQHQQRCRDRPHQLLPRGGHPQHVPRRPAARCPGPAGLRLPRRACVPFAVARQQPGSEGTWRHRDFQQVHIKVCTQVSAGKERKEHGKMRKV